MKKWIEVLENEAENIKTVICTQVSLTPKPMKIKDLKKNSWGQ